MATQNSSEILHDYSPRFIIYKDGRIERMRKFETVPPSYDPTTRVHSKDVQISQTASARVYRPDDIPENTKLPVLIYFHGGAFCQFSPFASRYHKYLNNVVSEARVIAVSVEYRLAPEHPIPACYEDTWDATKWVLSHSDGTGPEPWITQYGDLGRVFLAGDSAGGNMSHNMLAQAAQAGLLNNSSTKIEGVILIHPYFAQAEQVDDVVQYLSQGKMGVTDPRFHPMGDPTRMKKEVLCDRVLVVVDKDDDLKDRGVAYYEALKKHGWEGTLELLETNGGGHVFHLRELNPEKTEEFLKVIASFINNTNQSN